MPVIIANGFGGLFFHEACGHSLEATSVSDNGSEFSGKLGTKVASEKVTLIDDGSIRDGWGSGYIDDEGELTRKNVLIKDGILKNYKESETLLVGCDLVCLQMEAVAARAIGLRRWQE